MKYFLDCEFIEDGHQIDLISIGLVAEDGRSYYAISTEFDKNKASRWVWNNVIAALPEPEVNLSDPSVSPVVKRESQRWKSRSEIKADLLALFAGGDPDAGQLGTNTYRFDFDIQIWGEWCSYDWVAFCGIFGTMMDLPHEFPMRCRDIIQLAEDELGIPANCLPPSLETEGNHTAIAGARTVHNRYQWLRGVHQFRRTHPG